MNAESTDQVTNKWHTGVYLLSLTQQSSICNSDDSYYKLSALCNISDYCDVIDRWQKRRLPTEAHMCTRSWGNMFLWALLPDRGRSVQQSHRCRKHLLARPSSPVTSRPLWAARVFWPGRSSPSRIWKDTAQDTEYSPIQDHTKELYYTNKLLLWIIEQSRSNMLLFLALLT